MKTGKHDWIIEAVYDIHDPYLSKDKTIKEKTVLNDKIYRNVLNWVSNNIRKKRTEGPGGSMGWIEYWTLKKVNIYRIDKLLYDTIKYE